MPSCSRRWSTPRPACARLSPVRRSACGEEPSVAAISGGRLAVDEIVSACRNGSWLSELVVRLAPGVASASPARVVHRRVIAQSKHRLLTHLQALAAHARRPASTLTRVERRRSPSNAVQLRADQADRGPVVLCGDGPAGAGVGRARRDSARPPPYPRRVIAPIGCGPTRDRAGADPQSGRRTASGRSRTPDQSPGSASTARRTGPLRAVTTVIVDETSQVGARVRRRAARSAWLRVDAGRAVVVRRRFPPSPIRRRRRLRPRARTPRPQHGANYPGRGADARTAANRPSRPNRPQRWRSLPWPAMSTPAGSIPRHARLGTRTPDPARHPPSARRDRRSSTPTVAASTTSLSSLSVHVDCEDVADRIRRRSAPLAG